MAKKLNYRAPFDTRGNLMHYPSMQYITPKGQKYVEGVGYVPPTQHVPPEWREVVPFKAALTLQPEVTSGRSAKYLHWVDEKGRSYPMFVTDLVKVVLSSARINKGRIDAWWIVCKRGANYGIKLYGKAEK